MEWNYLNHCDGRRQDAGFYHSTQVFSDKYGEGRSMFTGDDYSQDLSLFGSSQEAAQKVMFTGDIGERSMITGDDYSESLSFFGSGQEAQKHMFRRKSGENTSMFGGSTDQGICLFENGQETQSNMVTGEYSFETNVVTDPHETQAIGGSHGLVWDAMSTVSNLDNKAMSYDDHQCQYLINTTTGGACVTINNGEHLTRDDVPSAGKLSSGPTRNQNKEKMYERRMSNCPDENRRIRNASRAHRNRLKKANEIKQMEEATAQVRQQIALLKQMKERQEATNEWLEYELHLRDTNK